MICPLLYNSSTIYWGVLTFLQCAFVVLIGGKGGLL